jgi:hypothetical protein
MFPDSGFKLVPNDFLADRTITNFNGDFDRTYISTPGAKKLGLKYQMTNLGGVFNLTNGSCTGISVFSISLLVLKDHKIQFTPQKRFHNCF